MCICMNSYDVALGSFSNVPLSFKGYSQVFISIVSFRIYSDSLSAIGFGFLIPANIIKAIPHIVIYQVCYLLSVWLQQYCLFVKFNSRFIVMDLLHELPHCKVAFCGFAGIIHALNKLIHIIKSNLLTPCPAIKADKLPHSAFYILLVNSVL